MRVLDLTILFVDTVPARIYLALLKKHGYLPNKILFVEQELSSKKYKLLKSLLGDFLSKKLYSAYNSHRLKKDNYNDLNKQFLDKNSISFKEINDFFVDYPVNQVTKLKVSNINDKKLVNHIKSKVKGPVLFTGGGILKKEILSLNNVKFIHIHPGIVPDVRGADCFFWSYLFNNKPGYSIFYMNEGIDTGDILYKKEFDIDFQYLALTSYKNNDIYHSILKYYDPCLRIKSFINLLDKQFENSEVAEKFVDLMNMPFEKQNPNEGRMYFFMHKNLRNFVINKLKSKA